MSKAKSRKASPAPVTDEDRTLRLSDDGTRPRKATMAAHAVSPHITSALLAQLAAEEALRAHLHELAAGAGIPAVCCLCAVWWHVGGLGWRG